MIESAKNKALDPAQNVTVTAKSQIVNEYHFAGAPDYEPISIVANTIEEATELWEKRRVALRPVEVKQEQKPETQPETKPEVKTKTDE
jgi:hypothetical protein